MNIKNAVVAGVLALALANAQAALFDRGGGLIYDDVLKVTWLQDANYAHTTRYDQSIYEGQSTVGMMRWQDAMSWAQNLIYGGYSDWRLPTSMQPDVGCSGQESGVSFGYGCVGSEMGHLYYESLRNSAYLLSNVGPFKNVDGNPAYWTSATFTLDPSHAWAFTFNDGSQHAYQKNIFRFAWAVRDGDVAALIPEPETYAMMLAGLGLIGVVARRRKQKAVA